MSAASDLEPLRSKLVAAAQEVYGAWDQDETGHAEDYGMGGICDAIAESMAFILAQAGFDVRTRHYEDDNHTLVWWRRDDGIWEVDIPLTLYERGSFYAYKKINGVRFKPSDITLHRVFKANDPHAEEEWESDEA